MSAGIRIVPFQRRQLDRILRIESASFGVDAWPRDYFLELYAGCRGFFFVAKIGGRIAGYALAEVGRRDAEIASLAIDPVYRRRGVARRLMRHLLRRLRARRIRRVELMVRVENISAAALYRSLGFRRVRRIRRYYEDGADAFLMVRAIQ